ncbi:MAG: cysteine desulfurase NifS [Bacillota bacterium]|nr:cysteine desulfurase NifS [Bacillota bacterium]
MDRHVYLDHAATTFVKKEVLDEMLPYFAEKYGNASSLHRDGREARAAIDRARSRTAGAIGARDEEIIFTSGGTESDNLAIKGVAEAYEQKGRHIITTKIEHDAVLNTCEYLEKKGFEVTYLPVDEYGLVSPETLEKAIRSDTILISVMFANNEIGTLEPIDKIGEIARAKNIIFHTDAVQAVGSVPIDVEKMKIDMLSLSAHKIYGPKGTGALYVKKGIKLSPQSHGGAHESKRRAGTENVPGIVGLGKAIELAGANIGGYAERLRAMREKLIRGIQENVSDVRLNGHPEKRLPGNANFSFEFIEGEALLLLLDMAGISSSTGSACTSGSFKPSHVLSAIGLPAEIAQGSVRFTFGDANKEGDADYCIEQIIKIVQRLRAMSPLFAQEKGMRKNV